MTSTFTRAFACLLLFTFAGAALAQRAVVEDVSRYPSKPIRIVVPSAPGGGTDVVARLVAQGLQDAWGQTVVVDNRGGAGGIPAVTMVAKNTAPDGYTICLGSNGHISVAPAIYRKLPFDPQKDITPVSLAATQPFTVVVSGNVPANSVQELIALAKAKPGALTYGSGGVGTSSHLGTELLQMTAGISLLHVPYKGTGPGMTAILSGELQVLVVGLAVVLPYVRNKSDKLKVLAVTSAKRAPAAPDLPTVAESGVPGYDFLVWYGLVFPGGTPHAIVTKMNAEIVKLLKGQTARERFAAVGLDAAPTTPEAFRDIVRSEVPKWAAVAKKANIQLD